MGCSVIQVGSISYSRQSLLQRAHGQVARVAVAASVSSDEEGASDTAADDDDDDELASTTTSSDPSAVARLQVVKDVSRRGLHASCL